MLIAAVIALIAGAFVMVLWNWLMPAIFELGPITYWQGFGLVLLVRLLVCGFGEHFGLKGGREYRRHRAMRQYHYGHFDDVYEQWWQSEGAERFEQYMKQREDKKTAEEKNGE